MSRNKKILIALTLGLGVASFFAFRKRKIRFFDYVWCADEACSNIEDAIAYSNPQRSRNVNVADNTASPAHNKPLTNDEVEVCVANADTIDDGMYNLYTNSEAFMKMNSFTFLDAPATTGAVIYSPYWSVSGGTIYMNRDAGGDTNRGVSTITVMEVSG